MLKLSLMFFFLRQGFVFDNSLCNLEVGAIVSGIILLEIWAEVLEYLA